MTMINRRFRLLCRAPYEFPLSIIKRNSVHDDRPIDYYRFSSAFLRRFLSNWFWYIFQKICFFPFRLKNSVLFLNHLELHCNRHHIQGRIQAPIAMRILGVSGTPRTRYPSTLGSPEEPQFLPLLHKVSVDLASTSCMRNFYLCRSMSLGSGRVYRLVVSRAQKSKSRAMSARSYCFTTYDPNFPFPLRWSGYRPITFTRWMFEPRPNIRSKVRTFESILWRGSNIRTIGGTGATLSGA